jgi:DNA repair exonuclease SbcCD ATPase subunit
MNTPTPRTDAAWSATFDSEQISAGRTARALRECSQQLETELAALTAERDQLRAEVALDEGLQAVTEGSLKTALARAERAEAAFADATQECKNVRLKWHAVMGTCAAREDAILESDEELARLRAELEKVYALVTPDGCDLMGGIFETAQAVSELIERAELAEAELATERARLDWLLLDVVSRFNDAYYNRATIDAKMKEGAK